MVLENLSQEFAETEDLIFFVAYLHGDSTMEGPILEETLLVFSLPRATIMMLPLMNMVIYL